MNRVSRKLISLLIVFAFLLQPFVPVMVAAQDAKNQKAQIDQAVADFQKTYDEIMAIEPIELGAISKWTLNRINDIKSAWSNRPSWLGGKSESPEEEKARREKEELERYVPKIEKANRDIKEIQDNAKKTMELLKSGSFAEAAKTDPSKVYDSLDENASALGIYQKALKEAGQTLLDAASALSTAGTILGSVALLCTVISAGFPPAAPIAGPIAAITGKAATAVGIASAILKASGNTLVTAADKAITDDKQFLAIAGKEATKAAAQEAVNRLVSKGIGKLAGDYATALVGDPTDLVNPADPNAHKLATTIIKKVTGDAIRPVKSTVMNEYNEAVDNSPLPPAKSEPGLNWE